MKVRKGFVSNSSSSSFVCDICSATAEGYDLSLNDTDMVECVKGHTMCRDHVPGIEDLELEDSYSLPVDNCPICQMTEVIDSEMVSYLLKRDLLTEEEVKAEIRSKFQTYDAFKGYVK